MILQTVGYRLNGAQMCRMAKAITGIDSDNIGDAYAALRFLLDDIPDYCWRLCSAPRDGPARDPINVVFVVYSTHELRPLSLARLRGRPRTATAKEWLRARGLAEIDDMRLARIYCDW